MNDLNLLGKEGFQEISSSFNEKEIIKKKNSFSDQNSQKIKFKKKMKIKYLILFFIILSFLISLIYYLFHFFLIDINIFENNQMIHEK
tara:strand:+ start:166 stop:429 length:264 start_codon:yes stop_codon:yes gene_type:complete